MTAVKYYAAYILALLGGDASPSIEKLSVILGSVGITSDESRAASAVAILADKDLEGLTAAAFACLSPFGSTPPPPPTTTSSSLAGEESSSEFEQPILSNELEFDLVD
jgi:large subunit ribosomal protein LP2